MTGAQRRGSGRALRRGLVAVALASGILAGLKPGARADAYFDEGVRLFNNMNYGYAANLFAKAIRGGYAGSEPYYYLALSYHHLGHLSDAELLYARIVKSFPGSRAATLSAAALRSLRGDGIAGSATGSGTADGDQTGNTAGGAKLSGTAGGEPLDATTGGVAAGNTAGSAEAGGGAGGIPERARVYFREASGQMVVPAQLNGRDVAMIFDTGAAATVVGKNTLADLSIPAPAEEPGGLAAGVGSAGPQPAWDMRVDLKVGEIFRSDFPIVVIDSLPTPLLGETFFDGFRYSVDRSAGSIEFVGARASAGGCAQAVAFRREDGEIVVDGQVNGRNCRMIFDTGASGSLIATRDQLQAIGVFPPADARQAVSAGIGGSTRTWVFKVDRVAVGPVENYDVPVWMVESAVMGHPLIGSAFFDGWEAEVDNGRMVICFKRR